MITQIGGSVARKLKGEMQTAFTDENIDYTVGLQVVDPFQGYVYENEEYFPEPQAVPFETQFFPDELAAGKWKKQKKWATKRDVKDVTDSVNNLHTKREAIEWRAGLKVTDPLQLYVHVNAEGVSREYLPEPSRVPFTTVGSSIDIAYFRSVPNLLDKAKYLYASDFVNTGPLLDATDSLRLAIKTANKENKTLFINEEYWVDAVKYTTDLNSQDCHVHGLCTMPNTKIEFGPNGVLKALATAADRYCVLLVRHENPVIDFPVIVGDRDIHITRPSTNPNNYDGFAGEWGYGIRVDLNASNVTINDPKVTKCWGDSYIIVTDGYGVKLNNPFGAFSRRQGISVIRGKGVKIKNMDMQDISGTWPSAAIDFESDSPTESIECVVDGFKSSRCRGFGVEAFFDKQTSSSKPHSIQFIGPCESDGEIRIQSNYGTNVKNKVSFDVCRVKRFVSYAMSRGDTITINELWCDEPPQFVLKDTESPASSLIDCARIDIGKIGFNDTSTRLITVTNPELLSKCFYTRDNVTIGEYILPRVLNIDTPVTSSGKRFRCSIGNVNSSETVTATNTTLYLNAYDALHVVIDRATSNTILKVDPYCSLNGSVKTVDIKNGKVTISPFNGAVINGNSSDLPTINAPCRLEFIEEVDGNNFIMRTIYAS